MKQIFYFKVCNIMERLFKKTKNLKILVLFLIVPFVSFSQNSKLGNWLIAFGNIQINEKWNWHKEIQYRNYNMIGDLEQLLVRTGVGYNLTENNNNLLLGYGYIKSENYISNLDVKEGVHEHRIFRVAGDIARVANVASLPARLRPTALPAVARQELPWRRRMLGAPDPVVGHL